MQLQKELGSYGRYIIHERLSFRFNTDGDVLDRIRDGKSGLVKAVTRESDGLYTIRLRKDRPYVTDGKYITVHPSLSQAAAPTVYADVHYVEGSWEVTDDGVEFQVQVMARATDAVAAAASDPDDGDRISVTLTGSVSSVGRDAA